MADESQYEDAVLMQVVVDEATTQFVVGVRLEMTEQLQVFLDVVLSVGTNSEAHGPQQDGQATDGGDEDEPEPDEEVDLLVEEVDGQDALDRVRLHVAKLTDLEVTERDARKTWRVGPVGSRQDALQDEQTKDVESWPRKTLSASS